MTKDEQIADLKAERDRLLGVIEQLTHPKDPTKHALRQRAYVERHKSVIADVSSDRHNDALPLERVDPRVSSGNGSTSEILEARGNTPGETSAVTSSLTWDRGRAEQDAAKHGLDGAAFEAELQRFTDYWDSAGWKRKGGAVKDRNATWRSWLDSPYRTSSRQRPLDGLEEWNRRMDAIEGVTS